MLCPSLGGGDPLVTILNKLTKVKSPIKAGNKVYWQAEHYNLDKSKLYMSLDETKKSEIIFRLNKWSLELIYFIEKFGLNYGAKMILGAESEEEKSLYSLFAGDEVRHRLLIEPFLLNGKPEDLSIHPLLNSLSYCLSNGTKETMTFTIQVILEGFGLMHYSTLRDSCQNIDLKNVFDSILRDEVGHHGMGVALTKKAKLNKKDKTQILDTTQMFVRSLLDAEWVLKSVLETTGGLTKTQIEDFRAQINWRESQNIKVKKMSQLISKVGYNQLSDELDGLGAFRV